MFLSKACLLAPLIHKNNVISFTILRAGDLNLSSNFHPTRTYSRLIDDDPDDKPTSQRPYQEQYHQTESSSQNLIHPKKSRTQLSRRSRRRGKFFNENYTEELIRLNPVDFGSKELNELAKNFYEPSEITQNRVEKEIREFRQKHAMTVQSGAPKPIFTFDELKNLPNAVLNLIRKQGFSECTPVQAQGMPIALSGKNMVGIAQTGSGKTLSFVLPAIVHILNQRSLQQGKNPIALVLAPTRELVQQIQQVVTQFGASSQIRSVCLCGGVPIAVQMFDINKGCDIVIATPGRLIDLLDKKALNLEQCSYLVLDEADFMMDMGFEAQIRQILSQIRPDRQTLMWSATWPLEVQELAAHLMNNRDFEQLTIGRTGLSINPNVKQNIIVCEEHEKAGHLIEILESICKLEPSEQKTLVFTRTRRRADDITHSLKSRGYTAEAIHGGYFQTQRDNILFKYRNGKIQVLVATDVASRGLDVSNIKHVINFDYPNNTHDYIHRIGRTGRYKLSGTSYTLFTEENFMNAAELVGILRETNEEIPPELIDYSEIIKQSNKSKIVR